MPSLPNPPRRGQSLADANLPETIARIIDYLRAITPRSSPTVRVSTTSSGTLFQARGRSVTAPTAQTAAPPAMFHTTSVLRDSATNTWAISTRPGTAQPLYGHIQIIPPLDAVTVAIPDGGYAVVYATLLIYDQNVEDYVWEWRPTLSVTVAENAQDIHNKLPNVWQEKYQVIAIVSSSGEVSQGHEGAIVLPVPKSIVDLEPPEEPEEDLGT
jgi:hypothetical protein